MNGMQVIKSDRTDNPSRKVTEKKSRWRGKEDPREEHDIVKKRTHEESDCLYVIRNSSSDLSVPQCPYPSK